VKRVAFVVAGCGFVGVAYLGAVLPGLPTTPWVLAASYCFGRSSPRLQRWLYRSPFFGRLLTDWHEHRGMRPRLKATAATMVVLACSFSIGFAPVPPWVKWAIAGSGLTGLAVILFVVPTVRTGSPGEES
jgi:hypothetical protein